MRMIVHREPKACGCNQYEIRDHLDRYVGWLQRYYSPWQKADGTREPGYVWNLEFNWETLRLDDIDFLSFAEAKEWINDHVT